MVCPIMANRGERGKMIFINGNSARCSDCIYFKRITLDPSDPRYRNARNFGECTNKNHLKTHVGKYVSGENHVCFDADIIINKEDL